MSDTTGSTGPRRRRTGASGVAVDTARRRPAWLIPLLALLALVVPTRAGYAAKVGVDAAEGATQISAQKQHIEIAKNAIKLNQ